jgi:hypothetical protein
MTTSKLIYIRNPITGAIIESTRISNGFAFRAARLFYAAKYPDYKIFII